MKTVNTAHTSRGLAFGRCPARAHGGRALPTLGLMASLGLLAIGASSGCSTARPAPRASDAVAAAPKPSASAAVAPQNDVPREIAETTERIFRSAVKVRKLAVREPVRLRALAPAELVTMVKKQVQTDIPTEVLRAEGHTYAALGLIPEDYDYEAETYALLEEQLEGLYMPLDRTMYVNKGISGNELEATLAHELVHALQDQHFGLGSRMKYSVGASDALGALHALAEGDATSAMLDELIVIQRGEDFLSSHTAAELPDQDPEDLLAGENQGRKGGRLRRTPRFLSVSLLAPYADGLRFVHELRRRGGWNSVNAAWARPPISTEQLLHIEKYDSNERPLTVPESTANALGPGFTKTYDEVFGEQQMRLALTEWIGIDAAKKAAAGWGGDRISLWVKERTHAVVWRVVFDDEGEAREAFDALSIGWRTTYGDASWSRKDGLDELLAWGEVPQARQDAKPTPGGKDSKAASGAKDAKGGPAKPANPKAGGSGLPALPDAPHSAAPPPRANPGCRAMRHVGSAVTVVAGAPCAALVPWLGEVGGAP